MQHRFRDHWPEVSDDVFIAGSADVIGKVTLGSESSVWFQAVLRGDHNEIRIGSRSNVQDGAVIHADNPIDNGPPVVIGDGVTIGHHVHLHGCDIGDNCLIGSGSIVLDGAVLPPYTFVAVGSVVRPNMKIAPGQMLMGAPARVFRPVNETEVAYIKHAAAAYVKLSQEYRWTESSGEPRT